VLAPRSAVARLFTVSNLWPGSVVCLIAAPRTCPVTQTGATWQTYQVPEQYDPGEIADDLAVCRQRGLDWLDRKTTNQVPVSAAALQQLAEDYTEAKALVSTGRVDQIKALLRDGIGEFSRQGHPADAGLLRDLFFGDSMDGPIKPPGELLKKAREKSGDAEARFRERRTNVMRSFAQFLIAFAAPQHAEHKQLTITTGYVGDTEHFIQLLADAVNVTIVGITNERLAPMLEEALRRKRASGRPDGFWGSLRIVFLERSQLKFVNDERVEFLDTDGALLQREREWTEARRSIRVFLKRAHSTRWTLYDYPYIPTVTGSIFEFNDQRKKIVHLLIKRPRQSRADQRYIELEDLEDQYFSALFEDIVHNSVPLTLIVPVGFLAGDTFQCTEFRRHADVLKDRSRSSGWLPAVLVVTFRRRDGHVEPVLQVRTEENSGRELDRVSHLSGHIFRADFELPAGLPLADELRSFGPEHVIPVRTARRVVREVIAIDPVLGLRSAGTGKYLYPDKEHLFFFIFTLELQEGIHFPRRAEMHPFPLSELLAIRASQALRSAARLCQTTEIPRRAWNSAAEIVALNLFLHDYDDLGERILGSDARHSDELARISTIINQHVSERTSRISVSTSREAEVTGLAGWQYREFFSELMPLYAQIGIDDAGDLLRNIADNGHKRAASDRLAELYHNDDVMASIAIEL